MHSGTGLRLGMLSKHGPKNLIGSRLQAKASAALGEEWLYC